MQIPIHYSLSDFQSNYKIDFVEASTDNNISFLEYFEQLDSKYENELSKFEDARKNLTELNKKLHQKTMDKLDAMYGMGKFEEQLKRQADDINEIDQFNERFKLPRRLLYSNRYELNEYIWTSILEFEKIIKFIQFEIANIPAEKVINTKQEVQPYEKERGVNVPYKIALLDEMGILENLNTKFTNKTDIYKILQFLIGGNIDNIKSYYNSLYGNYLGDNQITEKHREKAKQIYYK